MALDPLEAVNNSGFRVTPVEKPVKSNSHEAQYFLDCCVICGDLGLDVYHFAANSGLDVDFLLENHAKNLEPKPFITELCNEITRLYHNWFENRATDYDKAFIALSAIVSLKDHGQEFHWQINDALCAKLYHQNNLLEQHITEESIIFEIENNSHLKKWPENLKRILSNAKDILTRLPEDFDDYLIACIKHKHYSFSMEHPAFYTANRTEIVPKYVELKKKKQSIRSAIKKGIKLLYSTYGEEHTKALVKGDDVFIEGKLFNYKISAKSMVYTQKSNTEIIKYTDTPIDGVPPFTLWVFDKFGNRLCNTCVYISKTPVIDQIVAIKLYIDSGMEEELLKTANLFNRSDDFYDSEISKIKAVKKPSKTPTMEFDVPILTSIGNVEISNDVFNGEIVPWRNHTKSPIFNALGKLVGIDPININSLFTNDFDLDTILVDKTSTNKIISWFNGKFLP